MLSRVGYLLLSDLACPSTKFVMRHSAKKMNTNMKKLCTSSVWCVPDDQSNAKKTSSKEKIYIEQFLKYSHPLNKKDELDKSEEEKGKASRKPSSDVSIKKNFFAFESSDESPVAPWENLSSSDYKTFDASGSRIIYDITEEMLGISDGKPLESVPLEAPSHEDEKFARLNLKRGREGVYDLQDLVELLYMENAKDLVAITIPPELHFVDYMVIVTSKSQRHLNAVAAAVRKVYIMKMNKRTDHGLILEGRDTEWVAMDLGNIALHIMSPAERKRVDIESLWLCGPENDLETQQHAQVKDDDLFSLVDEVLPPKVEAHPYDITKDYEHPYKPVWEDEVLPDFEDINDENRNTYTATSIMEIGLRKHNKEHARKYRGRFRK